MWQEVWNHQVSTNTQIGSFVFRLSFHDSISVKNTIIVLSLMYGVSFPCQCCFVFIPWPWWHGFKDIHTIPCNQWHVDISYLFAVVHPRFFATLSAAHWARRCILWSLLIFPSSSIRQTAAWRWGTPLLDSIWSQTVYLLLARLVGQFRTFPSLSLNTSLSNSLANPAKVLPVFNGEILGMFGWRTKFNPDDWVLHRAEAGKSELHWIPYTHCIWFRWHHIVQYPIDFSGCFYYVIRRLYNGCRLCHAILL